jgi:hypothetical protein
VLQVVCQSAEVAAFEPDRSTNTHGRERTAPYETLNRAGVNAEDVRRFTGR